MTEAAEIIIATFRPTPSIPPGLEGRRIARVLKRALRKTIEGHGLECIDIRQARRRAPSADSDFASPKAKPERKKTR